MAIQTRRGLKVNLPATAPAGQLLITTDTHELYVGTGTSIAIVSGGGGGGGTTVNSIPAVAHKFLNSFDSVTGNFTQTQPTYSDISGTPSLSAVAISGAYADLSGRPSLATVAISGVYSDLIGTPSLAAVAISGLYSDLLSKPTLPVTNAGASHNFLTSYSSVTGLFTKAQPAASDITGLATIATTGAYSDLTGTPTLAASLTNSSHKWLNSYDASTGLFTQTRPDYSDLTGTPQLPVTNAGSANNFLTSYDSSTGLFTKAQPSASNITGLAAVATSGAYSDLSGTPTIPVNTTSTSHQFFTAYNSSTGAFTKAQPAASDVSGLATVATTGAYSDLSGTPTLPVSNAGASNNFLTTYDSTTGLFTKAQPSFSNISGTIGSGQIVATAAVSHQFITAISSSGVGTLAQPDFTDLSGTASTGQIPNLAASKITTGLIALARGGTNADLSATGGSSFVLQQSSSGAAITVAQLAFTDISGTASTGQIPNLAASKITSGQIALTQGGTNADLSGTGGTSFVLKQSSTGAAITVSQLAFSDLSGSIAAGQIGSGTLTWDKLGNAAGALTLANGSNATTFNQTSAAVWTWGNTTAATAGGATSSSPVLTFAGRYFTSGADAADTWSIKQVIAAAHSFSITNIAETAGNVVTLTVTSGTSVAQETVTLTGLTTGTWLNNQTVILTSGTATSLVFTDPTSHGLQASHAETGTVTQANPASTLTFSHTGIPIANATAGILGPKISIPGGTGNTGPTIIDATVRPLQDNGINIGTAVAAVEIYSGPSGLDFIRFIDGPTKQMIGSIGYQSTAKVMNIGTFSNNNYTTLALGPISATNTSIVPMLTFRCQGSTVAGFSSVVSDIVGMSFGSIDGVIPTTGGNVVGGSIVWSPISGTTKFTAININPIINQTSITGVIGGIEVATNVVTIAFTTVLGTAMTSGATTITVTAGTNTSINGSGNTLTNSTNRATVSVTNSSETAGSAVTLTVGTHTIVANDYCYISGLTVATWLNGKVVKITSVVANSTITFPDPTAHGTSASTPEGGGSVVTSYIKYSKITGNITLTTDTGSAIQQATGSYTALKVNTTETAFGGTAAGSNLLDLQVNNVSVHSFDRLGNETTTGSHGETVVYGSSTELLTLSTSGVTTDTVGNLLPAGSIIDSVVARITTAIATATDWKLGDTTPNLARFTSANATVTLGTTTVGLNQWDPTAASLAAGPSQAAAGKIRVTTTGTPSAGAIRITVFYHQFTAPTS